MSDLVQLQPVLYTLELITHTHAFSRHCFDAVSIFKLLVSHLLDCQNSGGDMETSTSKLIARFNTAKQTRAGGRDKNLTALSETCSGLTFEPVPIRTQRECCASSKYLKGAG